MTKKEKKNNGLREEEKEKHRDESWSSVSRRHCWGDVSCRRVLGEFAFVWYWWEKGDIWMNLLTARNMGIDTDWEERERERFWLRRGLMCI